MKWLSTLTYHSYEITAPGSEREPGPCAEAQRLLKSQSETLLVQTVNDCVVDDVSWYFSCFRVPLPLCTVGIRHSALHSILSHNSQPESPESYYKLPEISYMTRAAGGAVLRIYSPSHGPAALWFDTELLTDSHFLVTSSKMQTITVNDC